MDNENNKNNKNILNVNDKKFPYKVKISIDDLCIRKGPSKNADRLPGHIIKGYHNIYREKNGYGCIDKKNNLWISLKYTDR